jgi:hypothetical protein
VKFGVETDCKHVYKFHHMTYFYTESLSTSRGLQSSTNFMSKYIFRTLANKRHLEYLVLIQKSLIKTLNKIYP